MIPEILAFVVVILILAMFFMSDTFQPVPDYFENYGWAPWGKRTEWYRGKWYLGGHIGASLKMPRPTNPKNIKHWLHS